MTTGEIVRRTRKRQGLTVKQLSQLSGISENNIYVIERDATSPRMDTMLAIMRALDYEIKFVKKYKGGYY